MRLRWAALIAACVVAPSLVDRAWASPPPSSGLCIKTAVVHHDAVKVCRAVVGDRLVVFYFIRRHGLWFLLEAKPAAYLPAP